jgi:hypothetical protein
LEYLCIFVRRIYSHFAGFSRFPYVNEVAGKFDKLIENASSIIDLMKERRTALISAAVTGKIDVRNWQAPQPGVLPKKPNWRESHEQA